MKLSVIIPVYNVEKYIATCLESLVNQDIPASEYEIIIVNDGSTDSSEKIVNLYEQKHPNIKHLVKENGGPGSARNFGLKHAASDYIWFVDADDWIQKNCLNGLLDYVFTNDLDFCEFNYVEVVKTEENIVGQNRWLQGKVISNVDYISRLAMPYAPWNYIVRRQIIAANNLLFVQGIFHEDREFNIRLLEHCKRISYYDKPDGVYYYMIQREGSTMTRKTPEHYITRINSYIEVLKLTEKKFPYNPNIKNYAFYVQHLINDILAYSLVPLLKESAISNKPGFYKKMIEDNGLNYRADIYKGMPNYKFKILSLVRKNYFLTNFFLGLFNKSGTFLKRKA